MYHRESFPLFSSITEWKFWIDFPSAWHSPGGWIRLHQEGIPFGLARYTYFPDRRPDGYAVTMWQFADQDQILARARP